MSANRISQAKAETPSTSEATQSVEILSHQQRIWNNAAEVETGYPADYNIGEDKTTTRAKERVNFPQTQTRDVDIRSESATKFMRNSSQDAFYRYGSYKPGEYACPAGSEHIDTSHVRFLVAIVSHLKIYVPDDEDAFDELKTGSPLFGNLVHNEEQKEGLRRLTEDSDRMAVLIDKMGELSDIFIFNGSDEKQFDDQGA
ncbi:hypothetical protein OPT61_g1523 [Boeremia exigua]|uniref:Uncharacterized protein n=1 Tax=Boeremia exigua TaxID=749465 RepID=A0ACC2IQ08_9PLEO|nr:hypothetical protein OPT61_g1523 [Boeremia exigua]